MTPRPRQKKDDAYVTALPEHPNARKPDGDDPNVAIEQTLHRADEIAQAAILDLKGATDRARTILSDTERRVAAGQMGAESVGPLKAAIADAEKVLKELEDLRADFDKRAARLVKDVRAAQPVASGRVRGRG